MTIARDFEKDEEICKAAAVGPWTYDVYTRLGLTRYAVKGLTGTLMERTFHLPVFDTGVFQKVETTSRSRPKPERDGRQRWKRSKC